MEKTSDNMETIMQLTTALTKKQRKKDKVPFEVGSLIFESKEDYDIYSHIDDNIDKIEECIEEELITAHRYFKLVRDIKVKQTFWGGWHELFEIFPNAGECICIADDEMCDSSYDEVASRFFHKIHVYDEEGRGVNFP